MICNLHILCLGFLISVITDWNQLSAEKVFFHAFIAYQIDNHCTHCRDCYAEKDDKRATIHGDHFDEEESEEHDKDTDRHRKRRLRIVFGIYS